MRTLFVIALVALLLGVGVVAVIETDPGYVLLSYGNYTLETSLWVGLVLMSVALFLFYLLLRLIYKLIGGQRSLASWLGSRRSNQSQRNSTRGVISYIEGNWSKAQRLLLRGTQNNDAPLMNYLLAARASDRLQEPEKAHEYLACAVDCNADAAVAVELTSAEMKLQAGDYAQALAALDMARRNVGKHPHVLSVMLQAYLGLEDWDQLLELLPELRKHKVLGADALQQLERDVHSGRLGAASLAAGGAYQLHGAWQQLPGEMKHDPEMLHLYSRQQIALGAQADAEKTLVRALKQQWDGNLVRQYGLIESENVSAQLTQAERWLTDHPEDAQLLLTLGRLCLRDKLWGKARDYFESSYRLQPTIEVCAELGRLLNGLGEPKVAAAYYREGLNLAASDLPALPMPDKIVSNHTLLTRS